MCFCFGVSWTFNWLASVWLICLFDFLFILFMWTLVKHLILIWALAFHNGSYIMPFCASMQTHYALVKCDWIEQLALCSVFLNRHWSGVLTVLFGCYMADAMWNCCRLRQRTCHLHFFFRMTWTFYMLLQCWGGGGGGGGAVVCSAKISAKLACQMSSGG